MAVNTVVNSVVGKLAGYILNPICCPFEYIFFYDSKIETLRDKAREIEIRETDVRQLVVEAERNAETIKPGVKDWLQRVDDVKKQAYEVLESATNSEMHCLFHTCPNLKTRYSLGGKAAEKTAEVAKLQVEGTFQKVGETKPLVQTPYQNLGDFGPFKTRISTKKEIMEALKDKDVSIIGIGGMPGVGKTTMANEIANEVKVDKLFDEVAISVVSHDPDVIKIQDQLAEMLGLTIEAKNNKIVRAGRLRERLEVDKSKSILVILDDVWEYIELETIGIPSSGDDKGLKILLTSRFEDVCRNMGAQRQFDVNVLSQEESWELFKGNANISDDATDVIKGTAQKVARECGGLPLALLTVGKALRQRGEHAWKNALEELRNSSVTNIRGLHKLVYSRIEFSYNHLESDEAKSLLLQCSLFPEDFKINTNDLVRHAWGLELFRDTRTFITTRDRVNSIVDDLKSCYLLLSTWLEEYVSVHDVVRDVCLQIASKDRHAYMSKHTGLKEWPKHDNNESYNAMFLTFDEPNQLPSGVEYPNLKFLAMKCKQESLNISKDFFAGLKELRVLDFTRTRIQIPSSIRLLTNLRTLSFDCCTINIEIASIGNLKKLEVLSFYGSDLNHFPNDIAELSNLRSLDLRNNNWSNCCPLPPGILLQLKKLEELYMGIVEIRDDELEQRGYIIKEISSLIGLNTFQISTNDPQYLLQILHILCIEKLQRFEIILTDLKCGYYYISREQHFKRMRLHNTRMLRIEGITPLTLSMLSQPAMNSLMRRTEDLSVKMDMNNLDDHSLQVMERNNMLDEDGFEYLNRNHQIGAFDGLSRIYLYGIPRMKYLWRGVFKPPSFHNLWELDVENCPSITSLFSESVALCMVNLVSISISNCEMLEEIVLMDIEQNEVTQMLEFPKLSYVNLENLRNFKSFRSGSNKIDGVSSPLFEQVTLPNLKSLCLRQLDCTVKLLDKLRQIRSDKLKKLVVEHLDDVSILFDFEYTKDDVEISMLTQLKSLYVIFLPKLVQFTRMLPRGIYIFENLTRLEVSNCNSLRYLFSPSMANSLVALKEMRVAECEAIEEIIGRQEEDDTSNIEIVEEGITNRIVFPKLSKLILFRLGNLRNFKRFRSGSNKINGVFNLLFEQVTLPNLEVLCLRQLDCTVKLFDELRQIRSDKLTRLEVGYLDDVSILFDFEYTKDDAEISMLTQLEILHVTFLPKLVQFMRMHPKGINIFENLTFLQVSNCDSLRYLFSPSMANSLVALKEMSVTKCKEVEEIIGRREEDDTSNMEIVEEGITNRIVFPKLTKLRLFHLDRLRLLSPQNYELVFPSLEYLSIRECPVMTKLGSRQLNAPKLDEVWISQELPVDISIFFGF